MRKRLFVLLIIAVVLTAVTVSVAKKLHKEAKPKSVEHAFNAEYLPYKTKYYGEENNVFCDFENPIENVACLGHDAGVGVARIYDLNETETAAAIAIEIAGLLQKEVSVARQGLYAASANKKGISTNNRELCLINYYGICGNHQDLFINSMRYVGIPARKASVYFIAPDESYRNHALAEVMIDGKWRLVDITWGAVYLRDKGDFSTLMSMQEIIDDPNPMALARVNQTDMLYAGSHTVDRLAYATLPLDKFVLIQQAESGTMNLKLNGPIEKFKDIPGHIGTTKSGENMKMLLSVEPEYVGNWNFKVRKVTCKPHQSASLNNNGKAYGNVSAGDNNLSLEETNYIELIAPETEKGKCFVIFDKLEFMQG